MVNASSGWVQVCPHSSLEQNGFLWNNRQVTPQLCEAQMGYVHSIYLYSPI